MLSADSVPAPICVILASEVRLYREGIASALSSHGRLRIVATPGNRPDAAAAVRTLQPEVVIVDMSMAGALELTAELRALSPSLRIVAMAVREAVGSEIELAIDCHWNYGVQTAIALAQALEPCRLMWLEDPIPPENIAAIGTVQRNTRTPIATGENHYQRIDFERLDEALEELAVLAPEKARIVELRYFGGLTIEETAEEIGSSPASVKRQWAMARAWLKRALEP